MNNNAWFKKEKPLLGLVGTGGGASNASSSASGPVSATGGTKATPGDGYVYHYYTTSGSLVIASGGGVDIDCLIIGGGGRGGYDRGGGGGGGAFRPETFPAVPGTHPVTVGYDGTQGNPGVPGNPANPTDFNQNGAGCTGGDSIVVYDSTPYIGGGGGGGGSTGGQFPGTPGNYGGSGGPEIQLGHDGKITLSHGATTRIETTTVGASITGNLGITGTVDGVDIATRDTLFGGLTSSSGVLTNGVTATTQTSTDNTSKVATTAFVTTAVNNLINGAPAALDTLNELAAAMNDDAAFSTTVTNSLATKMPLAGGQFTGNITFSGSQTVDGRDLSVDGSKLDGIESNATADQTASEILTLIKTVDGSGSGLDADTLDGIDSSNFLRSNADDEMFGLLTLRNSNSNEVLVLRAAAPFIRFQENGTNKAGIQWHQNGYLSFSNSEDGSQLRLQDDIKFSQDGSTFYSIWHAGNDGSGSGLDSDTLDGQEGSYYTNASNLSSGTIPAARVPTLNQNTTGSAAT